MLLPLPSLSCPDAAAIPPVAHDAIDRIIQRAKSDKNGVYWQLGVVYRGAETGNLNLSLGYGTPGVLLALAQYYRLTADRQVAEILGKGASWVQHRARSEPFVHGFYTGTPGQWLLYQTLERQLPGCSGNWQAAATEALRRHQGSAATSVAWGCAGTIVAILACLDLSGQEAAELIAPHLATMLGNAGFDESGLFWDSSVTSLRPPLGFLFGNAGVEYSLAYSAPVFRERYSSAIRGSLARAEAAFSARQGNWPDFDAITHLRHGDDAALEMILDNMDQGTRPEERPEYSIGWAGGASGILLARLAVDRAFPDDAVGAGARADADRAIKAIEAAAATGWRGTDYSIQSGMSGVALALRAAATRGGANSVSRLAAHAQSHLSTYVPEILRDDISLATGIAGVVYALLAPNATEATVVDPLLATPLDPVSPSVESDPILLLKTRMPACARIPRLRSALRHGAANLRVVRENVDQPRADATGSQENAIQRYEIEVQLALATTNFRHRFWHELAALRRFSRHFGEPMDDNVLFGRFRLDDTIRLLTLDFDPATGQPANMGEKIWILRQPGSKGVSETRLSQFQHKVLEGIGQGTVALNVINDLAGRVQIPTVSRQQVAGLALKILRDFIAAGQLLPVKANSFDTWLTRRKLMPIRRELFPANS